MGERFVENRAEGIAFAGILEQLLTANLSTHAGKRAVFRRMNGAVAIALPDIDAAVTLFFAAGRVRIEGGIVGRPALIVRTSSAGVVGLGALRVVGGLPWCLDEAGRGVLGDFLSGRLKIDGIFTHMRLLVQLTKVMSVM